MLQVHPIRAAGDGPCMRWLDFRGPTLIYICLEARATAAKRSITHLLIIGCLTSTLLLGGFKAFLSTSILKEDPK